MSIPRRFSVGACCACLFAFSAQTTALAAPIVETFESFTFRQVITDQIPGLTISAPPGVAKIADASNPVIPAEPMGLGYFRDGSSGPSDWQGPIVIDFAVETSLVGAIIDFGNIGSGVQLIVFDGPNATGNILGQTSTEIEEYIQVQAAGIKSARFDVVPSSSVATYLIDNLTYDPIPEPTTLGLLVLGIVSTLLRKPDFR